MNTNWTETQKNILLLVGVILVLCAGIEIALRFLFPQPTYSKLLEQVGGYYAPSELNTFTLKKNYRGAEPSQEFPGTYVKVTTNKDGFRGAELGTSPDKILVVGDSYTFGVYVNDEETYPAVLNELITRNNPSYQVINAGYAGGFETDQQYVWLRQAVKEHKPRIVILGIFLGNDILGINTAAWKDLDANGLPGKWINNDLEVTGSGVIRNKNRGLSTVGAESVYKIPVLRESHFAVLAGRVIDKLISGRSSYSEESFKHIYGEYSPEFVNKEKLFIQLIESMKRAVEAEGGVFLVSLIPINFMTEPEKLKRVLPGNTTFGKLKPVYYDRLAGILAEKHIGTVNVEKAMGSSTDGPFFPANGEVHFNPKGNRFAAQTIYQYLVAKNLLK